MAPEKFIGKDYRQKGVDGLSPDGTIRISYLGSRNLLTIESLRDGVELSFDSRITIAKFVHSLAPHTDLFDLDMPKNTLIQKVTALLANERYYLKKEESVSIKFADYEKTEINSHAIIFADQETLNETFMSLLPEGSLKGWNPEVLPVILFDILKPLNLLEVNYLDLLKEELEKDKEETIWHTSKGIEKKIYNTNQSAIDSVEKIKQHMSSIIDVTRGK